MTNYRLIIAYLTLATIGIMNCDSYATVNTAEHPQLSGETEGFFGLMVTSTVHQPTIKLKNTESGEVHYIGPIKSGTSVFTVALPTGHYCLKGFNHTIFKNGGFCTFVTANEVNYIGEIFYTPLLRSVAVLADTYPDYVINLSKQHAELCQEYIGTACDIKNRDVFFKQYLAKGSTSRAQGIRDSFFNAIKAEKISKTAGRDVLTRLAKQGDYRAQFKLAQELFNENQADNKVEAYAWSKLSNSIVPSKQRTELLATINQSLNEQEKQAAERNFQQKKAVNSSGFRFDQNYSSDNCQSARMRVPPQSTGSRLFRRKLVQSYAEVQEFFNQLPVIGCQSMTTIF